MTTTADPERWYFYVLSAAQGCCPHKHRRFAAASRCRDKEYPDGTIMLWHGSQGATRYDTAAKGGA